MQVHVAHPQPSSANSPSWLTRPWRLLKRPLAFTLGWRNMMLLGTGLGLMSVAVTLFLQPFGTADYEADWRTLRLSGYALCFIIPFALFHALDRRIFLWQGRRWYLYNELLSRPLLALAVTSCAWLYNLRVINDLSPSWSGWLHYLLAISMPYNAVLLPLAVLAAMILASRWPERPPGSLRPLTLRGRNQGEALAMELADFLFAEAQQNYVAVHRREPDGSVSNCLLRTTLAELAEQIPTGVRVHRSYLVNPDHVIGVEGNARKREIVLAATDQRLPASPGLDPTKLVSPSAMQRHP